MKHRTCPTEHISPGRRADRVDNRLGRELKRQCKNLLNDKSQLKSLCILPERQMQVIRFLLISWIMEALEDGIADPVGMAIYEQC